MDTHVKQGIKIEQSVKYITKPTERSQTRIPTSTTECREVVMNVMNSYENINSNYTRSNNLYFDLIYNFFNTWWYSNFLSLKMYLKKQEPIKE